MLFKSYAQVKKEQQRKKDPSAFYFDRDDFIIRNKFMPNYLNSSDEDRKWLDSDNDFYLKTNSIYMADNEVKGMLILKKNCIVFHSQLGHSKANLSKLKKDEELFEKEIKQIEEQKQFEAFIDYQDILEVKVLVFESMTH
jgi:hypothetical protein